MSAERREKTREVLGWVEAALPAIPDVPGKWDDGAKVAAKGIITAIRRALARGRSPEELVTLAKNYADNPAARLELDAIGEKVKAELAGDDDA